MVAEIEIKLQDLAKLALGTPQLTSVNVAILQSLIDILLKKLNCHDEKVSLNAFDAKYLENLLKTAKMSPLVFNDENVEKISEKLERLHKLQENVQKLDEKLNRHLLQMQPENTLNEASLDLDKWLSDADGQHLCSACDEENELACAILKNTDLVKKLQRRMAAPIVDRLFNFEAKIAKLNEEFEKFIERAKCIYLNVQLLEKCMEDIDNLRDIIEEQKHHFLMTMEEIQDMLDSKLDKIHVPALKKYIRDDFAKIDHSINMMQDKQKCPRAAGIIMDGLRCVACGNANVCAEGGASMLPADTIKVKEKRAKKYCGVSRDLIKKTCHLENIQLDGSDIVFEKKDVSRCHKAKQDFEWLEGFDGKLYRKG